MSKYYDIGKALKVIRVNAGLTQTDIAEKMNMSKQQVSTYERNQFEPKLDRIHEYVRACGSNLAEFLEKARI